MIKVSLSTNGKNKNNNKKGFEFQCLIEWLKYDFTKRIGPEIHLNRKNYGEKADIANHLKNKLQSKLTAVSIYVCSKVPILQTKSVSE